MDAVFQFMAAWFIKVTHVLEQETFWSAVSACGTVIALYFIYRQIAVSSKLSAYEFLRREDERFHSTTLRDARAKLACELLRKEPNLAVVDLLSPSGMGESPHL